MGEVEKLLKEQLAIYRELLALSAKLHEKLGKNRSEGAEHLLTTRGEIINKIMFINEKIALAGSGIPEGSKTYSKIGEVLEEITVIDGKIEKIIKEGKEGVIENIKGLQKGNSAAKGYGSGRGKQQGGSGKFISIKE